MAVGVLIQLVAIELPFGHPILEELDQLALILRQ